MMRGEEKPTPSDAVGDQTTPRRAIPVWPVVALAATLLVIGIGLEWKADTSGTWTWSSGTTTWGDLTPTAVTRRLQATRDVAPPILADIAARIAHGRPGWQSPLIEDESSPGHARIVLRAREQLAQGQREVVVGIEGDGKSVHAWCEHRLHRSGSLVMKVLHALRHEDVGYSAELDGLMSDPKSPDLRVVAAIVALGKQSKVAPPTGDDASALAPK